jgi:hypothetical protein
MVSHILLTFNQLCITAVLFYYSHILSVCVNSVCELLSVGMYLFSAVAVLYYRTLG